MRPKFTGSFTQQMPIPDEAVQAAVQVMQTGRLHRYNTAPGEEAETVALEREFAQWQGSKYCLAVASGGQAMQIALRAAGVKPDDYVLTNAFTLAPVPGAIAAVGAKPVLVETTDDLVFDVEDLIGKAQRLDAKYFLLSNMRGHLGDMDRLMQIAKAERLTVIEDCAHTMGAAWNGRKSGGFGLAACFSTQTYKHLNSGEGGLITSDDATFMAQATMLSGSYMFYDRHAAGPGSEFYSDIRLDTPNMSARMDNLRAAILRPQLRDIDKAISAWNMRYDRVASHLAGHNLISLPDRPKEETYVGSSIQFRVDGISPEHAQAFLAAALERGVELKWFGAADPVAFTSAHQSWRYVQQQMLPETDRILAGLFDMRLPLTFSLEDCDLVSGHILDAAVETLTNSL